MNISISYIINTIFRQDSDAEAVELWNLPARSSKIKKPSGLQPPGMVLKIFNHSIKQHPERFSRFNKIYR